jgi:hypothetical protein
LASAFFTCFYHLHTIFTASPGSSHLAASPGPFLGSRSAESGLWRDLSWKCWIHWMTEKDGDLCDDLPFSKLT